MQERICLNLTRNLWVLYAAYPTSFQHFGGAQIQLLKTKEYLKKRKDVAKFVDLKKKALAEFKSEMMIISSQQERPSTQKSIVSSQARALWS